MVESNGTDHSSSMSTSLANFSTICRNQYMKSDPVSIWAGDNPLEFAFPIFMLQTSVATFFTGTMKFLLEPFGQTSFVSQMIGGIVAGPSILGRTTLFKTQIFSPASLPIFENFQSFACIFYLFLVGVKMDISMVKKSGKKAFFMGVSCFVIPLTLAQSAAYIVKKTVPMEPPFAKMISYVPALMSISSFHVVASFLADLKLLNSELGRLAVSSSMISGICSYTSSFFVLTFMQSTYVDQPHSFFWIVASSVVMIFCIVYCLRPIMFWMIRNTPEGKHVKEGYIFSIFVMVLICSFVGEVVGQHFLIGPMVLGIIVPVGPPLGAAIEDKLEFIVTYVFVPIYICANAVQIDFYEMKIRNFAIVEIIAFFSFLGKLLGTTLPAIYCKMPYQDALLLGFIMNAQGVVDMQICKKANRLEIIDKDMYSLIILSMVILTGTLSPLVGVLYNPSRRYIPYKRRTIQDIKSNMEFRILVCVYFEENVPTIINLLEASHPTGYSPICVYVVHLIQLQGRASPLFVAHKRSTKELSRSNPSGHIVNAFKLYEKHNENVSVNSFTAISPYTSMHDDICSLGLERRTFLIIIPYHQQPTVDSTLHSLPAIRGVNRNIINKSPCSVGILIDRGTSPSFSTNIYGNNPRHHVGVIFLGGADDREALAYGSRMSGHYNVDLMVVRFTLSASKRKINFSSDQHHHYERANEKKLDNDMINEFLVNTMGNDHIKYSEEEVVDGIAMVPMIQSIEKSVDLVIVGRQHGTHSAELLQGLEEWNEHHELGVIGDLLFTSETQPRGSILVIQQVSANSSATSGSSMHHDSPKYYCVV